MNAKTLRWNLFYQYGWVITNIINSILLLPLYLKNIDLATLGVWLATGSILTWMTLADPGIGEVLQQKIAEERGRRDSSQVSKLIGSGFMASGLILLISILVGLACYSFIGLIISKNVTDYLYLPEALLVSILATGLSLVSFTISGINQGLHNAAPVAICAFTANFLFLFTNLALLFLGYGVLSIALANLVRALYINAYNLIALFRFLKRETSSIVYDWVHLKKFSWIFSFTSASRIISGFANSFDLLILARFIPPSMIALFEINKRPANIMYSLVGRHSVALMPLISHARGTNDRAAIKTLISKHFRFYTYAAFFVVLLFSVNYEYLISAWTGVDKFAGYPLLTLILLNLFITLLGYFMSNMGYALGDIRRNSAYNIIRGLVYGVLIFFAAKYYGITGTLIVSISLALFADLGYFTWRVFTLGYLPLGSLRDSLKPWAILVPVTAAAGYLLHLSLNRMMPDGHYFFKLLAGSAGLSAIFLITLPAADSRVRDSFRQLTNKYISTPLGRLSGTRGSILK